MSGPHIWVPKFKIWEPNKQITPAIKVSGRYKLDKYKEDGTHTYDGPWFPNLITDNGLNLIGTSSSWMTQCHVGAGNTTPAVSDTSLVSLIASTTNDVGNGGSSGSAPDYYSTKVRTYRFSTGAAAGNIAEIGISPSSGAANLFSRALVLDGGGSPTTITVLSDEILDVTYEFRVYPPTSDSLGTISISGSSHDIVLRAAEVDTTIWGFSQSAADGFVGGAYTLGVNGAIAHNGAIGAITSSPAGSASNSGGASNSAYVADDLFRDFSCSWGLSAGNLSGGITSMSVYTGNHSTGGTGDGAVGRFQFSLSPAINKTSSQTLSMQFRHIWARR